MPATTTLPRKAHHPGYTPLSKVDDRMIREVGMKRFTDDERNADWRDHETGVSARSLAAKSGDVAEN